MSYLYDDGHGRTILSVLAGVVAGALLVGLLWMAQARSGSDPDADQPATTSQGQRMGDPTTDDQPDDVAEDPAKHGTEDGSEHGTGDMARDIAGDDQNPVALERCQEVYDAQTDGLEAATESLDQWEVHIGAMNKLVTGAITLQQANQFWNQTRVGAAHRLDRFDAAYREFGQRTARCPEQALSEESGAELRPCVEAVAARNRALRRASVALETWRMHVHHMEMLRAGQMTPAQATRLWLRSWRQGDREVKAYRAAARDADQAATC